jgi:hypothetical protein
MSHTSTKQLSTLSIHATVGIVGFALAAFQAGCVVDEPDPRAEIEQEQVGERVEALCSDTCEFAGDGQCDDGGSGSAYSDCALGTDCSDCGERSPDDVTAEEERLQAIVDTCVECLTDCMDESACNLRPGGLCEEACEAITSCPEGQVYECRYFAFDCGCTDE